MSAQTAPQASSTRFEEALAPTGSTALQSPSHQRAAGRVAVSFRTVGGVSRIARLHQAGCLKLRFPRLPGQRASEGAQAILINSSGGVTGGDRLDQAFSVEPGADLTITTQACERVYRSSGGHAGVATRLTLGPGTHCAYLPQETILFDGGALRRQLDVDADPSARFLLCESVILGRERMGEMVEAGFLHDRWRVRVGGRLVYADDLRLDGAIAERTRSPASLGGHRAFATIVYAAPDAEFQRDRVRALRSPKAPAPAALAPVGLATTGDGLIGGVSLVGGVLVLRLLAPSGLALRKRLIPVLTALAKRPLPLVWSL